MQGATGLRTPRRGANLEIHPHLPTLVPRPMFGMHTFAPPQEPHEDQSLYCPCGHGGRLGPPERQLSGWRGRHQHDPLNAPTSWIRTALPARGGRASNHLTWTSPWTRWATDQRPPHRRAGCRPEVVFDTDGLETKAWRTPMGTPLQHALAKRASGRPLRVTLPEGTQRVVRCATGPRAKALQWLEPAQTGGASCPSSSPRARPS